MSTTISPIDVRQLLAAEGIDLDKYISNKPLDPMHAARQMCAADGIDLDDYFAGNAHGSGGPASLLPQPACFGGNTVIEIAMLLTKANEQDKADNLKLEDAADVAAGKDDEQRVEQMQDKAQQDSSAALWTGLGEMAAGAVGVTGSLGAAGFADQAGKLDLHDVCGAGFTGKDALQGIGTTVAGGYKAGADHDDADAAKFQSQADADVRRYNRASGEEQAATQSIQQVQQYLQAILQTQAATNSAATGYRG